MTAPREPSHPCEYVVDHDGNVCGLEAMGLFQWGGHYEWRCQRHAPQPPTVAAPQDAPREPRTKDEVVNMDQKFSGTIVKNKDGSEVPSDQWVVFLVKDNAFPAALDAYILECVRIGASTAQITAVKGLRQRVQRWRRDHPDLCKVPDVEPGELQP